MHSLRSSRSRRNSGPPRLLLSLWAAGIACGLAAEWLARSGQDLDAAGADLAVGWTFIACGLTAWRLRPQSRVGLLLAIAGFAWFLGTLAASDVVVISALGTAALTIHRGPLIHAIIGYPSGRITGRLALAVVGLGYAYATIVPIARNDVVTIIVVLLVLATTIQGYVLASGPDRQARRTAIAAAAALTFSLAVGSVGRLLRMGPDAERAVLWGYEAALALIAIGFLVDLLHGRWARGAVTRLVIDLGEDSETGTLRARLAHALGDPSLAIAYWLPEASGYVDDKGNAVVLPSAGSGTAVTVIEQQGERIGALVHDATVLEDPGLLDAVASAARIALSNVRMQAAVRRQVKELEASRRRILEARDAQHRRLQQDLRGGVGQRLATVQDLLGIALERVGRAPAGLASRLGDAERELHEAQVELQELAAGIHPTLRNEGGLMAALAPLAHRTPCHVRLVAPSQRLPTAIETALYFVCSEALTNVGKYARASHVDVEVRAKSDLVTLLVADDGVGGADPSAGSGLEGAADRIEALGGRLMLESPAGRGTRLFAEIPR